MKLKYHYGHNNLIQIKFINAQSARMFEQETGLKHLALKRSQKNGDR